MRVIRKTAMLGIAMRLWPIVLTFLAAAAPAAAQPAMPCHSATDIAKQLGSKYDEAPVAMGLQSNGNLLQVYASEREGTWTVVTTTPAGLSCIVAVGKTWIVIPLASKDPLA